MTDRRADLEALVEKKGKPLHMYALAMEYRKHGEVDKAVAYFSKTVDVDPAYHPAYFMRAQMEQEAGEVAAARASLALGIQAAEAEGDAHAVSEMRAMLDELADSSA